MAAKMEKSLKLLSANDVIILHLFDNILYMARSEKGVTCQSDSMAMVNFMSRAT